jgi:hypothetical protein
VVKNEVHTIAETGGNSTSSNTGGNTTIATGDANAATQVKNAANTSVVDANGCNCQSQSAATTVSGNGTGSQTVATNANTSQTNVSVTNGAKIKNNITINANTGNNTAQNNTGGDTIIKTGDINVVTKVDNGPINTSKVAVQGNTTINSFLKIAGNGAFSENKEAEHNNSNTNIHVDNIATILNNVSTNLNTGNNSANFNVGGYTVIVTGNIDVQTLIKNVANFSLVEVVCGCKKEIANKPNKPFTPNEEVPNQPSVPAPPTTSVGGPGGPSSSGSSGSSSGSSSSSSPSSTTLPVTGNIMLFFFLVGNVMLFFLGMYLRLRSGRSPGYPIAL